MTNRTKIITRGILIILEEIITPGEIVVEIEGDRIMDQIIVIDTEPPGDQDSKEVVTKVTEGDTKIMVAISIVDDLIIPKVEGTNIGHTMAVIIMGDITVGTITITLEVIIITQEGTKVTTHKVIRDLTEEVEIDPLVKTTLGIVVNLKIDILKNHTPGVNLQKRMTKPTCPRVRKISKLMTPKQTVQRNRPRETNKFC